MNSFPRRVRLVILFYSHSPWVRRRSIIKATSIELGVKLSPEEAKAHIDALVEALLQRAERKVTNGRFMTGLRAGRLPREALKVFWQNWYGFVAEINNLIQYAYQFHLPFFKRHPDLMGPFADKVADELIHPKPPDTSRW